MAWSATCSRSHVATRPPLVALLGKVLPLVVQAPTGPDEETMARVEKFVSAMDNLRERAAKQQN